MTDLIKQVGGIDFANKIVNDYLAKTNTHVSNDGGFWTNENGDLIDNIRNQLHKLIRISDLRQAIADYNTDHCTNIENHISPSTKVIDR